MSFLNNLFPKSNENKTSKMNRPQSLGNSLQDVKYEQYINNLQGRLPSLLDPNDIDCKRWPWELIQNAKDTVLKRPVDQRKVNVVFKYYLDGSGKKVLRFTHDGDQFTNKAITGLIWKFSAEKRDEQITEDGLRRDKQSTGRFGTGFMTTHALSFVVDIVGSMYNDDENVKRNVSVEFTLHREGPTDKDYRDGVDRTENEMEFDRIPIPEGRTQLDTSFTYFITTESGEKAARIGLENIRQNAAQTMLFCPTVNSITIEDEINDSTYIIVRKKWIDDKDTIKRSVFTETIDNGDSKDRSFISYEVDEYSDVLSCFWHTEDRHQRLHVAIEVDEYNKIRAIPSASPSVYCALPLIGFEKMTLPFYVNSYDFETTENRTTLFLNQRESQFVYNNETNKEEKAVFHNGVNWSLLRRSINLYEKIVDYIVTEGYDGRYNLINGLGSIFRGAWSPEEKNCLAARYILPLRHMLTLKNLVKVNDSFLSISSGVKFIECGWDKDQAAFYDICVPVYKESIVDKNENQEWVDRKWTKFSFSDDFTETCENPGFSTVDYNSIANYVHKAASLDGLILDLDKAPEEETDKETESITDKKLRWLNSFYLWIKDAGLPLLLAEKALVPNRKGTFCTCEQGCQLKDASGIPSEVLTFMKSIKIDWDAFLVMEGVKSVTLEKVTSDEITLAIRNRSSEIIKNGEKVLECLMPLLLALPALAPSDEPSPFYKKRKRIVEILSTMHPTLVATTAAQSALALKADTWEVADKWFMNSAVETLARRGKIDVPKEDDSEEAKTKSYCTAQWLSDTLIFMFENGYLHQETISSKKDSQTGQEKGIAIVPNRYGVFKTIDQLSSVGAIPDQLLDDILKKTGFDIKSWLILDGFVLSDKLSIKDYQLSTLTTKYTEFFDSQQPDADKELVAKYLIHLLPKESDTFSETRELYDAFQGIQDAKTEAISSSDMSIWSGANTFLMGLLSGRASASKNLKAIGERLNNNGKTAIAATDEVLATLGLLWLNRLHTVLKQSSVVVSKDLCLYPDWNGTLQNKGTAFFDGSVLSKYQKIQELISIRKDLWGYYSDDKKSEEEGLLSKIVFPDFVFVNDFQDNADNVLFRQMDKLISYCLDNRSTESFPILKKSVSSLIEFFDENDFSDKKNETIATSFFPSTFPQKSDLQCEFILDKNTKKRLTSLNKSFSPEELDDLINEPEIVKDALKDKDLIKNLQAEINRLKELIAAGVPVVDDTEFADPDEGNTGEAIVWEELRKRYPESEGYHVTWSSRDYHEPRFDFKIEKNGNLYCYCDAKTTSRGIENTDSIPFFLRKSQYLFLEELKDTIPYYIGRVFVSDNYKVRFFRLSLK